MSKWFSPKLKPVAAHRPLFNVGCLFDIQTGKYVPGVRGEMILNGGVAPIEGVTGIGNSFKSTVMHYRMLQVFKRYLESFGAAYDTENSATLQRYIDLANALDPTGELASTLDEEVGRFILSSAVEYGGTEWHNKLKEWTKERLKSDKKIDTPFPDKEGKPIKIYAPFIQQVDSLSQLKSEAVMKKIDDNGIGEAELNTIDMNASRARAQLVDDLPNLTGKCGVIMMLSVHMGEQIVMDQYNAPKKKLAFVKGNKKMKKAPENFTFLTNNLFEITEIKPLINQSTKMVEFPVNAEDDMKGNTDLMVATIMPVRTKYGKTGIPFEIIISQTNGVQDTLSEFWYCRSYGRYGLGGNLQHVELELYPGVKFQRTTIRRLIKEDKKFCRAMQITADLCQMKAIWPEFAAEHITFTPTELYNKIREMGYDWDELLETRPYWTFDQYTNPIKFLSTMDLINMYHGKYKPYWKS